MSATTTRRDQAASDRTKREAQRSAMQDKARRAARRLARFTDLEYRHLERAARLTHIDQSHMRDQVVIARAKHLTAIETDTARHGWDLIRRTFEDQYQHIQLFDFLNPSEREDPDGHVLVLSGHWNVGYVRRRYEDVLNQINRDENLTGFIAVEIHDEEEGINAG